MTQREAVLELLKAKADGVTPADAWDVGVYRLSARIYDLRREGYRIDDVGKGYARYVLRPALTLWGAA